MIFTESISRNLIFICCPAFMVNRDYALESLHVMTLIRFAFQVHFCLGLHCTESSLVTRMKCWQLMFGLFRVCVSTFVNVTLLASLKETLFFTRPWEMSSLNNDEKKIKYFKQKHNHFLTSTKCFSSLSLTKCMLRGKLNPNKLG